MDQGPDRSVLGSDDVTDESTSLVEVRWSSGEEEVQYNKKKKDISTSKDVFLI